MHRELVLRNSILLYVALQTHRASKLDQKHRRRFLLVLGDYLQLFRQCVAVCLQLVELCCGQPIRVTLFRVDAKTPRTLLLKLEAEKRSALFKYFSEDWIFIVEL